MLRISMIRMTVSDSVCAFKMKVKICSRILQLREAYEERRVRLSRKLASSSTHLARREMKRRGRLTSRNLIRARILGRLRHGDELDIQALDRMVTRTRGDVERAMSCLKEATRHIDEALRIPGIEKQRRFRLWSGTVDSFLQEMRSMVDFRKEPGSYGVCVVELLISRLKYMSLNEGVWEQVLVRRQLGEVVDILFNMKLDQKERCNKLRQPFS